MCCSVVQYVAVCCSVDPYEPSPSIAVADIMRTKGAVDSVYGSTNCNGMNESFCLEGINPNLEREGGGKRRRGGVRGGSGEGGGVKGGRREGKRG